MAIGLLGKKLGMTQIYQDDGTEVPVTVIEAGPCTVVQLKTAAKEGYDSARLGFREAKQASAARKGPSQEAGKFRYLREFRGADVSSLEVGQKVDVSLFQPGDLVDITGISKGKGFAGVVKRHGFAGGPKTHGQSDRHRAPGSVGAGSSPGRVFKGLRMAGHMGSKRVTQRKLKVCEADPARNLLLVKGAVPGSKNGLLMIRRVARSK